MTGYLLRFLEFPGSGRTATRHPGDRGCCALRSLPALLLFALLPLVSSGCAQETLEMSIRLDFFPCFDHQAQSGDGLCNPAIEDRLSDGTAACLAWSSSENAGLLSYNFDVEEGVLRLAGGEPIEVIRGDSVDLKLFVLQPGSGITRCSPTVFTTETICDGADAPRACLFAFGRSTVNAVDDGVVTVQLGVPGKRCNIECNDECDGLGCTRVCWSQEHPFEEVCDNRDNLCDGQVDNVPGLGEDCHTGLDGVCGDGIRLCEPEQGPLPVCVPIQAPSAERCDGLDNACDGLVDNVVGLGEPCDTGVSGPCSVGVLTCDGSVDGEPVCEQVVFPEPEVCDGIDNSCNGLIDGEDPELLLVPCENQLGVCQGTSKMPSLCRDGQWVECDDDDYRALTGGLFGDEICDRKDNSCDGEVDNVRGLGDDCQTGLSGVCGAGVVACDYDAGTAPVCRQLVMPSTEMCDGLDNSCDGEVDNVAGIGTDCDTGLVGVCAEGTLRCQPELGPGLTCAAVHDYGVEVCDGTDNNCDGIIDNVAGRGTPCDTGLHGLCAEGEWQCVDGEGPELQCVQTVWPQDELCDGQDNSCDGIVDNVDGLGDPCAMNLAGVCNLGELRCVSGHLLPRCEMIFGPSPEVCDGQDNSCNGNVDDVDGLGEWCDTGLAGECANGAWTCEGAPDEEMVCEVLVMPMEEICDGKDNSCSGEVDDIEGIGDPCDTGQSGICGPGTKQCVPEMGTSLSCIRNEEPGVEVCDGQDNSCDGVIDNVAGRGTPCETEHLGVCSVGEWQCVDDEGPELQCVQTVFPSEEVCDGRDNSCDGLVDNVAGLGDPCDTGLLGICAQGEISCEEIEDGAPECRQTVFAAEEEICDDRDNTCSGQTDDLPGLGDGCDTGLAGVCGPGELRCDPELSTELSCLSLEGPSTERCDGQDNSCDGLVDNIEPVECEIFIPGCEWFNNSGLLECVRDEDNNPAARCGPGFRVIHDSALQCGVFSRGTVASYYEEIGGLTFFSPEIPRFVFWSGNPDPILFMEEAAVNLVNDGLDDWTADGVVVETLADPPGTLEHPLYRLTFEAAPEEPSEPPGTGPPGPPGGEEEEEDPEPDPDPPPPVIHGIGEPVVLGDTPHHSLSVYHSELGANSDTFDVRRVFNGDEHRSTVTMGAVWDRYVESFPATPGSTGELSIEREAQDEEYGAQLFAMQLETGEFATSYIPYSAGVGGRSADGFHIEAEPVFSKPDRAPYTGAGTWSGWFRPIYPSSVSTSEPLFSIEDGGGNMHSVLSFVPGTGEQGSFLCDWSHLEVDAVVHSAPVSFSSHPQGWIFVACSWDGQGVSLYVSTAETEVTLPPVAHVPHGVLLPVFNLHELKLHPMPMSAFSQDVRIYERALDTVEMERVFEGRVGVYRSQ